MNRWGGPLFGLWIKLGINPVPAIFGVLDEGLTLRLLNIIYFVHFSIHKLHTNTDTMVRYNKITFYKIFRCIQTRSNFTWELVATKCFPRPYTLINQLGLKKRLLLQINLIIIEHNILKTQTKKFRSTQNTSNGKR